MEEKMLFSSLQAYETYSQMTQQVEAKPRRRRKKVKDTDGTDKDLKKRKLTDEQVKFLEMSFGEERKLESSRKVHLAAELGLDPKQVAVWFQNRRARHKSKQMEDAFLKLRTQHDATVLEKCHLENEVMKLKERLSETEEEIRKMSISGDTGGCSCGGGSNTERGGGSPSSSFSTVSHQPAIDHQGFGLEGGQADELMYVHDYGYNNYMMDWNSSFYYL